MLTDDNCLSISKSLIYLLPNKIGKGRLDVFKSAFKQFQLTLCESTNYSQEPYVVVDDEFDVKSVLKILNIRDISKGPVIIRTKWLTDSLKEKKLLSYQDYTLKYSARKDSQQQESQPVTTTVTTMKRELPGEIALSVSDKMKRQKRNSNSSESDDGNDSYTSDIMKVRFRRNTLLFI
ncbi:unnamed protein product [Didymodactylos carnosus]|uniref:BRCT domain-containing protein n=1 Tax=Didymodactylos carnosus TaxID=1234261 RepID=A0A814EAB4_9BILA|nr:unnamed protein product [Didymodactylos carnosus]CAF3738478.1 unnamed protein product [Didymodactylos carnosus]